MDNLDLLDTILAELPTGWEIQINLERTEHKVTLYHPERNELVVITTEQGLHADVEKALNYAKKVEKCSDESVDKALARFQTAIKRLGG